MTYFRFQPRQKLSVSCGISFAKQLGRLKLFEVIPLCLSPKKVELSENFMENEKFVTFLKSLERKCFFRPLL